MKLLKLWLNIVLKALRKKRWTNHPKVFTISSENQLKLDANNIITLKLSFLLYVGLVTRTYDYNDYDIKL